MDSSLLDIGTQPGGSAAPGRFVGKAPILIAGLLCTLLIGAMFWGAATRIEKEEVHNPAASITDTAPRVSNTLGDYLDEAAPEPTSEPEPAPATPTPLPVISETEKVHREHEQQQTLRELQNRSLGQESSISISTASISSTAPNQAQPQPSQGAGSGAGLETPDSSRNQALHDLVARAQGATPDDQAAKLDFLEENDRSAWLEHTRVGDLGPLTLKTGAVIPGILVSGLNSDLPGDVIAQVSQNVYDTATGRHLLIPQGAKLYGTYDSRVSYGQNRALVVWQRIVFPDASTLELDRMQGVDVSGYSGYKDKINNHYLRTFGQLVLLSAIQAAPGQLSDSSATSGDDEFSRITAANTSAMGEKLIDRNLSIQPTIRIRPGYAFHIMVSKDIVFRGAYSG